MDQIIGPKNRLLAACVGSLLKRLQDQRKDRKEKTKNKNKYPLIPVKFRLFVQRDPSLGCVVGPSETSHSHVTVSPGPFLAPQINKPLSLETVAVVRDHILLISPYLHRCVYILLFCPDGEHRYRGPGKKLLFPIKTKVSSSGRPSE